MTGYNSVKDIDLDNLTDATYMELYPFMNNFIDTLGFLLFMTGDVTLSEMTADQYLDVMRIFYEEDVMMFFMDAMYAMIYYQMDNPHLPPLNVPDWVWDWEEEIEIEDIPKPTIAAPVVKAPVKSNPKTGSQLPVAAVAMVLVAAGAMVVLRKKK